MSSLSDGTPPASGPLPDGRMAVQRDVMIAMRDGVRLACDIYRPATGGQAPPETHPVLLERTPYGKGEVSRSERTAVEPRPKNRAEVAWAFVQHGYVVIYQDCRGRYASEGEFVKYLSDAEDGYDTLAWIVQQSWCNGRVGTMGLSYAAHTQAALACLNPPGLAAMALDSGGFNNAYESGIRQGGAFELKQATWAFTNARVSPSVVADPLAAAALADTDLREWFARMPWKPGHSPLAPAPEYERYLFEQWTHGTFDAYWQQLGIWAAGHYDEFADVPTLHISSWYDPYPRSTTANFVGLTARKRAPQRLILGPWTHGDRSVTYAGDVDFGPTATLDGAVAADHIDLRRRWFDRWLRDLPNGVDAEPTVRVFVMGGGSGRRNADGRLDHGGAWRAEAAWPLPATRLTPFYLHADRSLSQSPPADQASPLRYDHDPRHPVPTIGGAITSGAPVMVGGAFDQREGPQFFGCQPPYLPLASRRDVLVFQTPPLTEAVEVTGAISVQLWVASDCPDTDFTAKLIDVYPPTADYPHGYAMNLTDGILRTRYRDSAESPALMTPGTVYRIEIVPFPTSNRFERGHRIRLDIASSNFPRFDVNPNTGEPEATGQHARTATNSVYVDAGRASLVLLPIIPTDDQPLNGIHA